MSVEIQMTIVWPKLLITQIADAEFVCCDFAVAATENVLLRNSRCLATKVCTAPLVPPDERALPGDEADPRECGSTTRNPAAN
jgi:hypothetical protein